MNAIPGLALIGITLAWFLLPLIPAIAEFLRPTDVAPLRVVPRDTGDVAFLAKGFRQYLTRQTGRLPAATPADFIGRLPDGTLFARIRAGQLPTGPNNGRVEQDRVVRIDAPITISGAQTFRQEIHATADFHGGADSVYRALLGEAAVTLGDRSRVLRWIHAGGPLTIGKDSVLQGRVSSDRAVTLAAGVAFDRIGAPSITVAGGGDRPAGPAATAPFKLPEHALKVGAYTRIVGDLEVPPGTRVVGDIVVTGRFTLGAGAVIDGSAKVHGAAVLEAGAQVLGSLVGVGEIGIGPDGVIHGPIIAEGPVEIGPGSRVGRPDLMTTVAADSVVLGGGVAVFGQIVARNGGRTQA